MATIETWQVLKCDCGSDRIVQLVSLNWKPGGGTNPQAAGYACWECGKILDPARMITRADVTRKRVELDSAQKQLEAQEASLPKAS